jgi:hypothetical protein
MEKYLFTDGTNVIREAESKEELQKLILSSADPARVRIWIFNTSEWITLSDFNKRTSPSKEISRREIKDEVVPEPKKGSKKFLFSAIARKTLVGIGAATIIFLIYNFTRVTWRKASALSVMAERPANTPATNIDSIIATIELIRGQKLDKTTRTNLRIRTNWPELLQLRLDCDRDTSREGIRYYNMTLAIDNSTGYQIDQADVKLTVWKNEEPTHTDTFSFRSFGYSRPVRRLIDGVQEGDSISVAFSYIRSRVFNFCYSEDKQSNYSNYNDRWFCKD